MVSVVIGLAILAIFVIAIVAVNIRYRRHLQTLTPEERDQHEIEMRDHGRIY